MSDAECQRAAIKRARARGTATVHFITCSGAGYDVYSAGSSQDEDTAYTVTVDPAGVYHCTCPAEFAPACIHRAQVYLVRIERTVRYLSASGSTLADLRATHDHVNHVTGGI